MIEIHLHARIAQGRREAFDEFMAEAIPFYESPGGIRVRMLWDVADPQRFVEVIEYVDQAAHNRDQVRVENDVRMRDLLERWRDLLDGPPTLQTFMVGK